MRVLFAVAVSGLLLGGCAVSTETGEGDVAKKQSAASDESCRFQCQKCPPGKFCTMECRTIGNCGQKCNAIGLCVEGYTWDETACRCIPSNGTEKCGTATCPAGQVCCNESCGICTEPGGACIQMICSETSPEPI